MKTHHHFTATRASYSLSQLQPNTLANTFVCTTALQSRAIKTMSLRWRSTKHHQFICTSMVRSTSAFVLMKSIRNHSISIPDPENLLVENHQHNFVIGKQFQPFVIPCKPTSPNVKVELIREDGEVNILDYNETIGFLVSFDEPFQGELMTCWSSLLNQTQELTFTVEVDFVRRFRYFFHSPESL